MCVLYYSTCSPASNMRETFSALKSGKLTKFSSCRGISSKVLHLLHFIFRRGLLLPARNSKKHKATYGAVVPEHTLFVKRFSLIYRDSIANITPFL